MALSFGDLYQYALNAGFSGDSANTISAIALAESGGNPYAYNPNDPAGGSYGLTQINGVHPGAALTLGDPQAAFNQAYTVSSGGTNFGPWSTYTSGAYQKYLSGAASAASPSGTAYGFDPTTGATTIPYPAGTPGTQAAATPTQSTVITRWLSAVAGRVGLFTLALIFLAGAFLLFAFDKIEPAAETLARSE